MTDKNRNKAYGIMFLVLICCTIMAFVEIIVEPVYAVKSAIKVIVFFLFPLIYGKATHIRLFDRFFALDCGSILKLLALGCFIYAVIFGGYVLTKNIFDYSSLAASLSADQKVDSRSFLWVASDISFCNSFIEEFLFRFISFIKLSQYTGRKTAYIFSSVVFAVYHIAMIGTSFPLPLLLLVLMGLTIGGFIFDYTDKKSEAIYNSWMIHMFADFAIMTVWYLHI